MRSSSVFVLGALTLATLSACSVSTTGNSITSKTQTEFVDSSQPAKTSTADWNGEAITLQNDGVNPLTGTGGIQITLDPNATKITAKATFAARADDDAHKADADASIADAIGTFKLTEGNAFNVSCNHGAAHGTSGVASSGCKLLQVTIPAGSAAKPLSLTIGNGNGDITFTGTATASALSVKNNGSGNVSVNVIPTKGSTVTVESGFDATVALPANFAADHISFAGPSNASDIVTTDFPTLQSGAGFGTAGTGAASISITAGSVGTLTIKKL